jgi:hypothetical protein
MLARKRVNLPEKLTLREDFGQQYFAITFTGLKKNPEPDIIHSGQAIALTGGTYYERQPIPVQRYSGGNKPGPKISLLACEVSPARLVYYIT